MIKLLEIFTKEYRDTTKYMNFMEQNLSLFKLQDSDFDVDASVERLSSSDFVSNFRLDFTI